MFFPFCFNIALAHGPDPTSFDSLDSFWSTPNAVRTATGRPAQDYWQQEAHYTIHVHLDPESKKITGSESILYVNNSPDDLHYVWMQLDPNYLSQQSAHEALRTAPHLALDKWSEEKSKKDTNSLDIETIVSLESRLRYDPALQIENVRVDNVAIQPIIRDTQMRLSLDQPLKPGEVLSISLDWSYILNDATTLWARSGYEQLDDEALLFEVAQFYPRMSIYSDKEGWLTKPYLGTGEFACEFGNYDVHITVPADYIVGATGLLQNGSEVLTKQQLNRLEKAKTSDEPVFIVTKTEAALNRETNTKKERTWHYKADNVRDFAWGASNTFVWDAWGREIAGETVMAMSFYPSEGMPLWDKYSTHAIAHTLEFYSKMLFPYPYPVAISMNGPIYGMEYPMLSFNGPRPLEDGTYYEDSGPWSHQRNGLISVIIHEVGHNWFPMIVNSDERSWLWMDEGINTYIQSLAELEWSTQFEPKRGEPSRITQYMSEPNDVPIMTDAESVTNRGNNSYAKPAVALNILRETVIDPELFDQAISDYASAWAFKRPYPEDFFRSIEDGTGTDLDWFWRAWFYGTNHVDLGISSVSYFTKEALDPETRKSEAYQQNKMPKTKTKRQQRVEGVETYADRNPKLRDFYDSYDPLADDYGNEDTSNEYDFEENERAFLKSSWIYNQVVIENYTGMPSPVILEITYTNQETEVIKLPADIWRKDPKQFTKLFLREFPIEKVRLDPFLETADVDMSNNQFPPRIEEGTFSITPSKSLPPNPMQSHSAEE